MRRLHIRHSILPLVILTGLSNSGVSSQATQNNRSETLVKASRLRSQHHSEAAADLLRTYLGKQPDDPDVLIALGDTLLDQKQPEEAGRVFARALAASPTSSAWARAKALGIRLAINRLSDVICRR